MPSANSETCRLVLKGLERFAADNATKIRRRGRVPVPLHAQRLVKRYADTDAEPLTWFHSESLPEFDLAKIQRSMRHRAWAVDSVTGLQAVALMLRFSERTGLALTSLMVHRMLLVAILVAAKAHHDSVPRNSDFARAAGLPLSEMNRLERALVSGVDWHVVVTKADVQYVVARFAATRDLPTLPPHTALLQAPAAAANQYSAAAGSNFSSMDASAFAVDAIMHEAASRSVTPDPEKDATTAGTATTPASPSNDGAGATVAPAPAGEQ